MSRIWLPRAKPYVPPAPKNEEARWDLMGWGPEGATLQEKIKAAADQIQALASEFQPFFIAGQTESSAGKTVRGWEHYRKVTGCDPNLVPQPTGNCVAAATDDVVEGTNCVCILAGLLSRFVDIYNPFHYATGRVLVGKNRLRGPGSLGSWQALASTLYGHIEYLAELPKYIKANVDAWGDDRKAEGKSFRDYMDLGKKSLIKTTALVTDWTQLRDGLFGGPFFATIANNRGYTMKPDKDGYHRPSGNWSHQRSVWGYSEAGRNWVAIKNQWGNVHGELRDFETGELWPLGFLRVRLEEFIKYDLMLPGTECIVYSGFDGFPQLELDFGGLA